MTAGALRSAGPYRTDAPAGFRYRRCVAGAPADPVPVWGRYRAPAAAKPGLRLPALPANGAVSAATRCIPPPGRFPPASEGRDRTVLLPGAAAAAGRPGDTAAGDYRPRSFSGGYSRFIP